MQKKILRYLTILPGLLFLSCSSEKVKTIDFSKKLEQVTITNGKKGEFHVAVSAMTSPKQTLVHYQRLIRYIAERLDLQPHFVQRKTYKEINDLLSQKRLDYAFICSGAFVDARIHQIPLKLLAIPVINQKTVYHSVIIVNKDFPAHKVNDLRGCRFAFTDPMSNTGYRYMQYFLMQENKTVNNFFSSTFFTYGHDNSIQAVNRGIADAACVDELIYNFLKERNPEFTANTRVIHRSPAFGIPPRSEEHTSELQSH